MDPWGQQEATNPSKLSHTLLNGTNYLSWARSVTFALSARDKIDFITGDKKKPEQADPLTQTEAEKAAIRKWQKEDHAIISWLHGSMEQQISDLFIHSCNTSKELWDSIRAFYGQQKNHSHVYRLKQEIQQEKKGTGTHIEYLGSLKKKFDELRIYRPFTIDPQEIMKRQEEDEIFQYLSGFDSSYDIIRSQIIRAPNLPSFAEVISQIQREESLRLAMGDPQTVSSEGAEPHSHAVRNHQNPNSQNHPNRQNQKGERCSHCKKEGHKADRCYFLHPHLKPKWWKEAKGGTNWNEEKRKEKEKGAEQRRVFLSRPIRTLHITVQLNRSKIPPAHKEHISLAGQTGAGQGLMERIRCSKSSSSSLC